ADAAALVHRFNLFPPAIEFGADEFLFVEDNGGARKQIEERCLSSGYWSVELPSGKDSDAKLVHCAFHDLARALHAFAGETGVNGSENLGAHGIFRERQQRNFVARGERTLR